MPLASVPRLTVVVVSFNGLELLERCLHALRQHSGVDVEVLVVRRSGADGSVDPASLVSAFPSARWVAAPADANIPQMRRMGVAEARGDVLALIEDDCLVDAHWVHAILAAHATDHIAVGGAVEPGMYRRALDWAVYFCDYARFMLPLHGGDAAVLPGNNVSYKRAVVDELLAMTAAEGLQEAFVHQSWSDARRPMKLDPAVVVRNEHRWTVEAVSSVPYHHGRAFAGRRALTWGLPKRVCYSVAAILLPVVHMGRILERVASRRGRIGPLARALPWIGVFGLCWSAGECAGYAFGPGASLQRWR